MKLLAVAVDVNVDADEPGQCRTRLHQPFIVTAQQMVSFLAVV